ERTAAWQVPGAIARGYYLKPRKEERGEHRQGYYCLHEAKVFAEGLRCFARTFPNTRGTAENMCDP
ncbi:MAG: hypothetical protein IJX08_08155, partial [Clostridia bacterium]|nr:hypothetical protein [Clostridia bacterium]